MHVLTPGAMPKGAMLELCKEDEASMNYSDERRVALVRLRGEIEKYPWDDCSAFLSRREAIKSVRPTLRGGGGGGGAGGSGQGGWVETLRGDVTGVHGAGGTAGQLGFDAGLAGIECEVELTGSLEPHSVVRLMGLAPGPFRMRRLQVLDQVARDARVIGVDVNHMNHLSRPCPPGTTGLAFQGGLGIDVPHGEPIVLTVENIRGFSLVFMARLLGTR